MAELEQVGVRAVVENYDNFRRSIDVVRKEILRTGDAAKSAAKQYDSGTGSTGKYEDAATGAVVVVKELTGVLAAFVKAGAVSTNRTDLMKNAVLEYSEALAGSNKLLESGEQAQQKQGSSLLGTAFQALSLYRAFGFLTSAATKMGIASTGLAGVIGTGLRSAFSMGASTALSFARVGLGSIGTAAIGLSSVILPALALAIGAKLASAFVYANAASEGVILAFNKITQSVGLASNALLNDLQRAAANTVSDMELLTSANLALAGSSGLTGQAIGKALPRLLEIARVQASATGQDIAFLFNSLVTGIKRSSPMLIDNTGLVLKVGEANAAYAESIGKTVDQLTAQEQQIALLEATLKAGDYAVKTIGLSQETLAVKLARTGAILRNIRDEIGIAFQPLFKLVQDQINLVLAEVQDFVRGFAPMIRLISIVVAKILEILLIIPRTLLKIFPWERISRQFFLGGAEILAALTNGILFAANKLLFPAIIAIATFIADFLSGESPPPRGPLSKIDKGGANTMIAWLEGFTGVSLEPVRQVASQVQNALFMGGVAGLSREGIEARFAQLDAALQPFIDKLDIVKSQFEDLREPAEAALRAIDSQLNKAVQALVDGQEGSAEMVRQLDRQREAIRGALDAQQDQIDNAQIQLALAKQQQATERTLLAIRLRQLGPAEAVAKASEKAAGAVAKGVGGAADLAGAEGEGVSAEDLAAAEGTDAGPGGIGILSEAEARFLQRTEGQRAEFAENQAKLGTQVKRITDSGLVKTFTALPGKIGEALSGLPGKLKEFFEDKFNDAVNFVKGLFDGDASVLGLSLSGIASNLGSWLGADSLTNSLKSPFLTAINGVKDLFTGEEGSLKSLLESLPDNVFIWLIGLPIKITEGLVGAFLRGSLQIIAILGNVNPLSIGKAILGFVVKMGEWLINLPALLGEALVIPFENARTAVIDFFVGAVGIGESILNFFFGTGPGTLSGILTGLDAKIQQSIVIPIQSQLSEFMLWMFDNTQVGGFAFKIYSFFAGTGENSLSSYIDQAVAFFTSMPGRIASALSGLGLIVWNAVAVPVIEVLNQLIHTLNSFSDNVIGTLNDSVGGILETLGIDKIGEFHVEPISTRPPSFLTGGGGNNPFAAIANSIQGLAGGAEGGLFGPGLLKVGERGQELVASSSKMAVFPNEFVRAIDVLSSVMTNVMSIAPALGGTTVNNVTYDNSLTGNFNGMNGNGRSTFREFSLLRAFR